MEGKVTVQNITAVRNGVWLIVYTHTCDCGCKTSRHNFIQEQKAKPTDNKAKQLADAHYSQQ